MFELMISPRERDLGGFSVRRVLPYAKRRMVGPFVFFDHMGPAEFPPGKGITVRPHPHIHLATVTYLFEGKIHHRDSLGSDQNIEPGAINWMTAGRGIVHSERAPLDLLASGSRLNGIQCWVALPESAENCDPAFSHHAADSLPEFSLEDAHLKLLLGRAFGRESPVPVHSDMLYLDGQIKGGGRFRLPAEKRELAIYVAKGKLVSGGQEIPEYTMAIAKPGTALTIEAKEDSRFLLLGGEPLGERFIYWNFVSSSEENIEAAKRDWRDGPGERGSRFPKVPGDDQEFIPLPEEKSNGTMM